MQMSIVYAVAAAAAFAFLARMYLFTGANRDLYSFGGAAVVGVAVWYVTKCKSKPQKLATDSATLPEGISGTGTTTAGATYGSCCGGAFTPESGYQIESGYTCSCAKGAVSCNLSS